MSNYFDKKDISNHAISIFLKEGPKEFKLYLDGKYGDKDTKDLRMGKQVHSFLLENSTFNDQYFVQEESSTGLMNTLIEKLADCTDWIDGKEDYSVTVSNLIPIVGLKYKLERVLSELEKPENSKKLKQLIAYKGKLPISAENYHICESIGNSVLYHPTANRIINSEQTDSYIPFRESEVFWNHKDFRLNCKAKIDICNIDVKNYEIELVELKKTSKPIRWFEYEIKKYGYHRQLSWYINEAIPALMEENNIDISNFKIKNRIIACQSYFPYSIRVIQLDDVDMIEGQKEYNQALERIKWHIDNDFWEKQEYYEQKDWIDYVSLFGTDRDIDDTKNRE